MSSTSWCRIAGLQQGSSRYASQQIRLGCPDARRPLSSATLSNLHSRPEAETSTGTAGARRTHHGACQRVRVGKRRPQRIQAAPQHTRSGQHKRMSCTAPQRGTVVKVMCTCHCLLDFESIRCVITTAANHGRCRKHASRREANTRAIPRRLSCDTGVLAQRPCNGAPVALDGVVQRAGGRSVRGLPGAMSRSHEVRVPLVAHVH